MSLENSKWRIDLHGVQEYQIKKDWITLGVLWTHS